nr:universal stress protein [Candidatus Bathyarchaeota archaeon]
MYKKMLVALDGSETAERALEKAIEFAKLCGSQLILLNVIKTEDFEIVKNYSESSYDLVKSYLSQSAEKMLGEAEEKAKRKGVEDVVKLVLFGDPADTIVNVSETENVDLIVMGTRGLTGVKRIVLGSTAQKVIRWSKRDVLVVH